MPTKVPYQCDGSPAKTNDSSTWASYTEVHQAFRNDRFKGIGFVFSDRDPYAGIDLDDCLDPNGSAKPWASPILDQFTASHCEISPSHGGVKCFVIAALPGQGKSVPYMDGRIEMYDRGRFFTVTGQAFGGSPWVLADCQASVTSLYDRLKMLQSFRKGTTEKVPQGQRHQYLISVAGKCRVKGMEYGDILAQLAFVNQQQCDPPKPLDELEDITQYVCQKTAGTHDGTFAAGGHDSAREHQANPAAAEPTLTGEAPRYLHTPQGLLWVKRTREGIVPVSLTNFSAKIVADITRDDGVEQSRLYEVVAEANGKSRTFMVPAAQFAAMNWPGEKLGASAIVYAGSAVKDHARAAIQRLSENIRQHALFTHTGWRKVESGWIYLHAEGAIGADASSGDGVGVELDANLQRFVLPAPPAGPELVAAIRASMQMLDVAPLPITAPLFCAIWRAALGKNDVSIHMTGDTGEGKTCLAAMAQQHFGRLMTYREPPASWESTENALEELAFQAKDVVLLVDDFVPKGDRQEMRRYHAKADRLFRSQGNRSARLRQRADGTVRPARPPRGFVLSTGEEIPEGVSIGARRVDLFVPKKTVDWDWLTKCQADALAGLYAAAFAAYIRWLAPAYEDHQKSFLSAVERGRNEIGEPGSHKRSAENLAQLETAFGVWCQFALHHEAISSDEAHDLRAKVHEALTQAASSHRRQQESVHPTRRFLDVLATLISSGRAHVADRKNAVPADPIMWGWRREGGARWRPCGDCIGWLEKDDLYLDPDASYAAVQKFLQDSSQSLGISLTKLALQLHGRGILCGIEEKRDTFKVRRTIHGRRRDVFWLHADSLSPSTSSDQPDQGSSA